MCPKKPVVCALLLLALTTFLFVCHVLYWTNSHGSGTDYDLVIISDVGKYSNLEAGLLSNWTSYWMSTPISKRLKFVFYTDEIIKWQAAFPHVDVKTHVWKTCDNLPTLNGMFETSMILYDSHFYMFVNRGAFVSMSILKTLKAIYHLSSLTQEVPVLALAKSRIVSEEKEVFDLLNVDKMPDSNVRYAFGGNSDIFVTNGNIDWSEIPEMLTHLQSTSQFLTTRSRQEKVVLVDVTKSVNVIKIRQKGVRKTVSRKINRCIKNMFITANIEDEKARICGNIICVNFETLLENGDVKIKGRDIIDRCNECLVTNENEPIWLPN